MRLRHLTLLLVLAGIGLTLHQFSRYFAQWDEIELEHANMVEIRNQLETAIERGETQQGELLQGAEQEQQRLIRLLPGSLMVEELQQSVTDLAATHRLKLLAERTAITSRPHYLEASLDITLEGTPAALQDFITSLRDTPRLLQIDTPPEPGKTHHQLSVQVYAVEAAAHSATAQPECRPPPSGIWLALLDEPLQAHYQGYLADCHFVTANAALYLQEQRLQALLAENRRLSAIEQALRSPRP